MQATVTNTQVAVTYRWNVSSLLIDMSADNRITTLGRHTCIDQHIGRVSLDISTNARPECRSIWRLTHLGRHIDLHSTDMSANISVNTGLICKPIHWSSVDRYVDQYWLYRSRGAQNTHDPII